MGVGKELAVQRTESIQNRKNPWCNLGKLRKGTMLLNGAHVRGEA